MNESRFYKVVAVAAVVIVAANTILTHVTDNRVTVAREATRIAVARADTALAAKALSDAIVRQIAAEAALSIRDAQRAEAKAIQTTTDYNRLRRQFAAIEPSVSPDSIIAAADSALAAADTTIDLLRSALGSQIEATAQLQEALATEQSAHRQTASALTNLKTSSSSLVAATRPSLIARILPKAGFGAAAGLDLTGRPNVVVGVTLSFR
jgi:hypothetical protein